MLLLCEDDRMLGEAIVAALSSDFQVEWVCTLEDARLAVRAASYDLLVVDLGLPDGSGLDLVQDVRSNGIRVPIIILTARNAPPQRVEGLNLGADDYIGKPFDLGELIARCHAAIRRARGHAAPELPIGPLVYDKVGRRVLRDGRTLDLSARELRIFDVLAANVGRIVSKDQIEERLHHLTGDYESNAVEVYISRLRRKIGADMIQTVRGIGYLLQKDQSGS